MGYQDIFKRYELKYMITKDQKQKILETIDPFMKEDQYGRSTICNIYYDTPDSLLIRRSLEKPFYKEKLRLRSYGVAGPDKQVFVELKKKYDGVVYKRRVGMTEKEAMAYLSKQAKAPVHSQITDEIDYFLDFYEGIYPAMYLSYEREAFFGKTDDNLRITFDENILWREEDVSLCKPVYGTPILESNQVLMEIKVAQAIPMELSTMLSKEGIFKNSFSKYGTAYLQKTGFSMIEYSA